MSHTKQEELRGDHCVEIERMYVPFRYLKLKALFANIVIRNGTAQRPSETLFDACAINKNKCSSCNCLHSTDSQC
jgi:hypothetical protein